MNEIDAKDALDAIQHARRQTSELIGYQVGGSVVAAWGMAWVAGFSAMQFVPESSHWIWGLCWVAALGWTASRPRAPNDSRVLATWAVAVCYVGLITVIVGADVREASVIIALAVAGGYAIAGIWAGWRFACLGGLITVSAIVGWWFFPKLLFLSLGLGGGTALLLGGLWLKRP
jgi:FtsH-binding integral membrane protein